jgi:hypothetical protein
MNVKRRHLTETQLALLAVKVKPMYEAEVAARKAHGETAPGRTPWGLKAPSVETRGHVHVTVQPTQSASAVALWHAWNASLSEHPT